MNNNAVLIGLLETPEVRIGLFEFAIRILDCTKALLVMMRESEVEKLAELKKANKLVA